MLELALPQSLPSIPSGAQRQTMGEHFSDSELDSMHLLKTKGFTPVEIHRQLQGGRAAGVSGLGQTSQAYAAL